MLSSTLALFTRSFRVDARSTQPHVLRLLFAGVILMQLIWTHEMEVVLGAPGLTVFTWIAWLNFVVISLGGLGYFATAISEEKEEDSLGLLKMAGISPVALLLGKSTSRLIAVLLLLAVEFPFVLLSITLGGVTMTQVIAMATALAAYLVFVANLGLICSVVGTNSRRASTMMTLSLVFLLVVLPALGEFATFWTTTHPQDTLARSCLHAAANWERGISMWIRVSTILATGFSESAVSLQVVFHLVAAMGLFGLSWTLFERFTRETHTLRPIERAFARPSGGIRRQRISRTWALALAWKDFHFIAGGRRVLIACFVLYFLIIGGLFWILSLAEPSPSQYSARLLGGIAMVTMLGAGALQLGLLASRVFREEVKANTLPLLMMLPESTAWIAWTKASAAVPALIPVICYFLLGALLDAEDFARAFMDLVTSLPGWYAIGLFVLFLHLAAYLSLVVKWGALPLAIFLIYLSQMILFSVLMMLSVMFRITWNTEIPVFVALLTICSATIVIIARLIPRRLRLLAGR
jgi:ABC-type transport system involved in cytochrome c biogenesis permease component